MSNIKKEDYLCLNAMLRAREAHLLTRERAERMIAASTAEEAARLLAECGYDDLSKLDHAGLEEALSARMAALLDELEKMAPDPVIVQCFRVKCDYHNAKAVLKAEAAGTDCSRALIGGGRVPCEKMRSQEYGEMPVPLAEAMRTEQESLRHTHNPQRTDFELDRACYREAYDLAKESGSEFLVSYLQRQIDLINLKTAVRSRRMGKSDAFLHQALVKCGAVPRGRFYADAEALAVLSEQLGVEGAACTAAMKGGRLTAFELACDNALNAFLQRAKQSPYGEESLVAYLAAAEAEITAVRMIFTGRLSGIAPEAIRERMRDFYA